MSRVEVFWIRITIFWFKLCRPCKWRRLTGRRVVTDWAGCWHPKEDG
jgi:hypothetical protein